MEPCLKTINLKIMKKILSALLFVFAVSFTYAQQTANGNVKQATPVMKVDATPAEHPVTDSIGKGENKACCQKSAEQGKSCCQQGGNAHGNGSCSEGHGHSANNQKKKKGK